MKRTFVVPDEKEDVYEKFKKLVPEVSGGLVRLMEEVVTKHEAQQAGMVEQATYSGTEFIDDNVFQGKTLKFYGVQIAKGQHGGADCIYNEVYLTFKGKFLVYTRFEDDSNRKIEHYFKVYESYSQMKQEARLSVGQIKECEASLSKNSTVQTCEYLDI
jgi:hypothetical protein